MTVAPVALARSGRRHSCPLETRQKSRPNSRAMEAARSVIKALPGSNATRIVRAAAGERAASAGLNSGRLRPCGFFS